MCYNAHTITPEFNTQLREATNYTQKDKPVEGKRNRILSLVGALAFTSVPHIGQAQEVYSLTQTEATCTADNLRKMLHQELPDAKQKVSILPYEKIPNRHRVIASAQSKDKTVHIIIGNIGRTTEVRYPLPKPGKKATVSISEVFYIRMLNTTPESEIGGSTNFLEASGMVGELHNLAGVAVSDCDRLE